MRKIFSFLLHLFLIHLPLLLQLPAIEQILPEDVETATHRREGRQVCLCHPDGEDGVFLTDGLSATDAVVVAGANLFANDVEDNADYKARNCHQDVDVIILGIVDDGVHHICHKNHHRTSPEVKRRRIVLD